MHITIDRSSCISCGACWNNCPEIFDQNPCDGLSEIVDELRFNNDRAGGFVPDDSFECAREAANLCPVEIITIEER